MKSSIFKIIDNKPRIEPEGIHIPELMQVWYNDKTKHKKSAQASFAYIYHMTNPAAMYANYPEHIKEDIIITDIKRVYNVGDRWKPTEATKIALEKYRSMIETPTMRLLRSATRGIDKLASYFDSINFDRGEDGMPIDDPKKFVDTVKQLKTVASEIKQLREDVKKEMVEEEEHVYGDKTFGMFGE